MIDTVNKRAVSITTIITERDLKIEYLFRTSSVATNPVTPPKSNPIRCGAMVCPFRQTRSSYVAINFILCGSTVTSSATGDYVAIPERFDQNEEPAGRNKERTRKRLSCVPAVDSIDAICQTCKHEFFP